MTISATVAVAAVAAVGAASSMYDNMTTVAVSELEIGQGLTRRVGV